MASLGQQIRRRKPVVAMAEQTGADSGEGDLSRSFGLTQLSAFGIGSTIGTGIFIVFTPSVPVAGPAVVLSFAFAGLVAGLTAICYAELASAVPVSGSSYSYAYATLGEGVAIVVAACLLLEYGVASAAVAVGWSQYLNELFDNLFGFVIPENLANAPEADGIFNLPAVVLIVLCMLLLIRGASESATVNTVMVGIKISVLLFFVAVGVTGWNSDNLSDFAPFGFDGVTSAAGIIFFSYIGLDAVSTAGEEVENPRRNLPLAIIIALLTVTTLYLAVAIVAVAAQPVAEFRGPGGGSGRDPREGDGRDLAGDGDQRRCRDLDLQRHPRGHVRADADPVCDGPRRHDPLAVQPSEPADAHPGSGHHHRGRDHLDPGRPAAHRVPGRDDQHRHPGGLPDRFDRGDGAAPDGARPSPRLQGPAVSDHAARCRSPAASGSSPTCG